MCVLIVLLVIGVAVFSVSNKNPSQSQPDASVDNSNTSTTPVMSVLAPKLYLDYQANEVRADNIYKGKRLAVRGIVAEIRKDFTNSVVIALGTDAFETVDAHLVEDDSSKAAELHKWEIVNLICDGDGMIMTSPQLGNCSFDTRNSTQLPAPVAVQPEPEPAATPQDSSTTETVTTPSQPTTPSLDSNESKPAPIIRQSPPGTQPQH